jgi:hypothetical protein
MKSWKILLIAAVLGILFLLAGRYWGMQEKDDSEWLSHTLYVLKGQKIYIIDLPLVCNNGKNLGKLQADVNLKNGKLRIVRNDAGLDPNCDGYTPQLPAPIPQPAPATPITTPASPKR